MSIWVMPLSGSIGMWNMKATVKSFTFVRHLILCIWWKGRQSMSIAYSLKFTNSNVHKHVQCRQTTNFLAHEIKWFHSIYYHFSVCVWQVLGYQVSVQPWGAAACPQQDWGTEGPRSQEGVCNRPCCLGFILNSFQAAWNLSYFKLCFLLSTVCLWWNNSWFFNKFWEKRKARAILIIMP